MKLINLLNIYINKPHIQMKPIMKSIRERLKKNLKISKRQFEVLIPYIQIDLKNMNKKKTPKQLTHFFSSIIYGLNQKDYLSEEQYLKKYYPKIYNQFLNEGTLNQFMK